MVLARSLAGLVAPWLALEEGAVCSVASGSHLAPRLRGHGFPREKQKSGSGESRRNLGILFPSGIFRKIFAPHGDPSWRRIVLRNK